MEEQRPWSIKCDVALPSATQNEIEAEDARNLVKNGCKFVFEGANMPSNNDAIEIFKENNVVYFPAKVSSNPYGNMQATSSRYL